MDWNSFAANAPDALVLEALREKRDDFMLLQVINPVMANPSAFDALRMTAAVFGKDGCGEIVAMLRIVAAAAAALDRGSAMLGVDKDGFRALLLSSLAAGSVIEQAIPFTQGKKTP